MGLQQRKEFIFADDARGWQCPFVLCLQPGIEPGARQKIGTYQITTGSFHRGLKTWLGSPITLTRNQVIRRVSSDPERQALALLSGGECKGLRAVASKSQDTDTP